MTGTRAVALIDPIIAAANDDVPQPGASTGAILVHIVNPLSPDLGARRFSDCAGFSVLEAVERAEWTLRPSTVLIRGGEMVRRAAWDQEVIGPHEIVFLITLPLGGGKSGSQIFAVVASIALALFAPELAVSLLGQDLAGSVAFAGVTWGNLATVGIVLAGQTLISALLPHPKPAVTSPANTGAAQSPTYSLSAQSNQARLYAAIPERFGQTKFLPDLCSAAYFDFVNSQQELKEEFCVGIGDYSIDEMGISNTPFYQDGAPTGAYTEIEYQLLPPGTTNTLFSNNVVTSADVSNMELIGNNEAGYDWLGPFPLNPTTTLAQRIEVDLSMPGGLFAIDDSGNLKSATASFEVDVQVIDDAGTPSGGWASVISETLTLSSRDAIRTTYGHDLDPARYQVRFRRTNSKATDLNTQDGMALLAMRGYLPNVAGQADTYRIAIKARSTQNLNGDSAQKFYVIATRKLPLYDADTGTWSAPTATREIAPAAAYLCKATNGLRRADNQTDLDKLDYLDGIWQSRGDKFDGTFDDGGAAWTALQALLRVGRAEPLRVGRYITFNRDEPKAAPRGYFSPANMLAGSFNVDHVMYDANSTDAVWVAYIDARSWTPQKVLCALPDSVTSEDDAPTVDFSLGVTDRDHAWREGMFIVACNRWRRRMPNFLTELEGRANFRGDRITIAHWMMGWGASGQALYIDPDDAGDIVTLSEPWDTLNTLGDDAKILTLVTPDGQAFGPVTVDLVDDGADTGRAQVRLTQTATVTQGKYAGQQPRDWLVWDDAGLTMERPRAAWGTATNRPLDALMLSMKPQSGMRVQMAAVIDDARVHYADGTIPPLEGDTPAPPAESVIPSLAQPDDLAVTGVILREVSQAGGLPQSNAIAVTVQGAPNAASFDAQWKWGDAADYEPLKTGLKRTFNITAVAGTLTIRVRAEGLSGIGDFHEQTITAEALPPAPGGDDAYPSVGAVSNPTLWDRTNLSDPDDPTSFPVPAEYSWDAVDTAIKYLVQVEMKHESDAEDWSVFISYYTTATDIFVSYAYTGTTFPLRQRVGVKAVYVAGTSPAFTYPS
jgi:hypothetical protein